MDNIIRGNYIALRRIAGKHPSHRTPHEVALLRTLIVELADDVPDDVHLPLVAGHLRERQFGRDDDEDIRAERRQARKAREDAETERKIAELLDEEPTATAPSKKEAAEEEKAAAEEEEFDDDDEHVSLWVEDYRIQIPDPAGESGGATLGILKADWRAVVEEKAYQREAIREHADRYDDDDDDDDDDTKTNELKDVEGRRRVAILRRYFDQRDGKAPGRGEEDNNHVEDPLVSPEAAEDALRRLVLARVGPRLRPVFEESAPGEPPESLLSHLLESATLECLRGPRLVVSEQQTAGPAFVLLTGALVLRRRRFVAGVGDLDDDVERVNTFGELHRPQRRRTRRVTTEEQPMEAAGAGRKTRETLFPQKSEDGEAARGGGGEEAADDDADGTPPLRMVEDWRGRGRVFGDEMLGASVYEAKGVRNAEDHLEPLKSGCSVFVPAGETAELIQFNATAVWEIVHTRHEREVGAFVERAVGLGHSTGLAELSPATLAELKLALKREALPADYELTRQGEPAEKLFLLCRGEVLSVEEQPTPKGGEGTGRRALSSSLTVSTTGTTTTSFATLTTTNQQPKKGQRKGDASSAVPRAVTEIKQRFAVIGKETLEGVEGFSQEELAAMEQKAKEEADRKEEDANRNVFDDASTVATMATSESMVDGMEGGVGASQNMLLTAAAGTSPFSSSVASAFFSSTSASPPQSPADNRSSVAGTPPLSAGARARSALRRSMRAASMSMSLSAASKHATDTDNDNKQGGGDGQEIFFPRYSSTATAQGAILVLSLSRESLEELPSAARQDLIDHMIKPPVGAVGLAFNEERVKVLEARLNELKAKEQTGLSAFLKTKKRVREGAWAKLRNKGVARAKESNEYGSVGSEALRKSRRDAKAAAEAAGAVRKIFRPPGPFGSSLGRDVTVPLNLPPIVPGSKSNKGDKKVVGAMAAAASRARADAEANRFVLVQLGITPPSDADHDEDPTSSGAGKKAAEGQTTSVHYRIVAGEEVGMEQASEIVLEMLRKGGYHLRDRLSRVQWMATRPTSGAVGGYFNEPYLASPHLRDHFVLFDCAAGGKPAFTFSVDLGLLHNPATMFQDVPGAAAATVLNSLGIYSNVPEREASFVVMTDRMVDPYGGGDGDDSDDSDAESVAAKEGEDDDDDEAKEEAADTFDDGGHVKPVKNRQLFSLIGPVKVSPLTARRLPSKTGPSHSTVLVARKMHPRAAQMVALRGNTSSGGGTTTEQVLRAAPHEQWHPSRSKRTVMPHRWYDAAETTHGDTTGGGGGRGYSRSRRGRQERKSTEDDNEMSAFDRIFRPVDEGGAADGSLASHASSGKSYQSSIELGPAWVSTGSEYGESSLLLFNLSPH